MLACRLLQLAVVVLQGLTAHLAVDTWWEAACLAVHCSYSGHVWRSWLQSTSMRDCVHQGRS